MKIIRFAVYHRICAHAWAMRLAPGESGVYSLRAIARQRSVRAARRTITMPQGLRVLFISPLFSPFQIEVGEALNRIPGLDYRAVFPMRLREARRQPHWTRYEYDPERYQVMPDGQEPEAWLTERIRSVRPDVLISGQCMGALYAAVLRTWPEQDYKLGFWMEPPDPFKPLARRVAAKEVMRLRLTLADFIFGIGLRAEQYYRSCAPQAEVTLVPYGEDLSECFSAEEADKPSDKLSFLFSGQLIPRHNIDWILLATEQLLSKRGPSFELVISGEGVEQAQIDAALLRNPALHSVIRYDREFGSWADRLRPFRHSHVFLYPTRYAGWGLVIPEAMAAGATVLSTPEAEAAAYFVRHRVNGIFLEPGVESLEREMRFCFDNRAEVREMGRRARLDAIDGHAPNVAARVASALARLPESRARSVRAELAHRVASLVGRVSSK